MIFTPDERRALLALVALLLLGQGVSIWENRRRARPDREVSAWLNHLSAARADSMAVSSPNGPGGPRSTGSSSRTFLARRSMSRADSGSREVGERDGDSPVDAEKGDSVWGDSLTGAAIEPMSAAPPGVLTEGRLRINEASQTDLERLPGIGPALAGRILADRLARGPFRLPADLLRVPGIGEKKLERIRSSISWVDGGAKSECETQTHGENPRQNIAATASAGKAR